MHIKVRSRGSHFGMHWDPANVALTLMLVLLFLIFLLLFLTLTAPPALGGYSPDRNGLLCVDAHTSLYGPTEAGGCPGIGCGVVFEITP